MSTDGFCFCSYTPSQPGSLKYHYYRTEKGLTLTSNLQKSMEQCPFVSQGESYDVKVIIETEEFTTLPVEYDSRQDYKAFHRLCFPKNDVRVEVVANRLNALGLTVLFPVEKSLYERFQQLGNVEHSAWPDDKQACRGREVYARIFPEQYMFLRFNAGGQAAAGKCFQVR